MKPVPPTWKEIEADAKAAAAKLGFDFNQGFSGTLSDKVHAAMVDAARELKRPVTRADIDAGAIGVKSDAVNALISRLHASGSLIRVGVGKYIPVVE